MKKWGGETWKSFGKNGCTQKCLNESMEGDINLLQTMGIANTYRVSSESEKWNEIYVLSKHCTNSYTSAYILFLIYIKN